MDEKYTAWYTRRLSSDENIQHSIADARTEIRVLKENTRLAWEISPEMAVYLPSRFRNCEAVRVTVQSLVRAQPEYVIHLPEALPLFLAEPAVFETNEVGIDGF